MSRCESALLCPRAPQGFGVNSKAPLIGPNVAVHERPRQEICPSGVAGAGIAQGEAFHRRRSAGYHLRWVATDAPLSDVMGWRADP